MSNENLLPTDGIKTYFSFDELYGNLDNCITCIIEKLKKGNICAFVGAGFSCNANKSYPDWSTLLIDAYREMHTSKSKSNSAIKNVIRNERETKVAQQYVEFKGHREAIDTYIESKLTPIDCSPKNSLIIHKKLLDLNWADVITTNWDTLLEQAASGEYEVVKTAKQLKVDNHKRIIKVNGSLRSKDDIDAGEYWFDGNFDHLYIITEDVLSLSWLLNDTTGYARSFEDYLRYCSFTEPTTLDVSIVGICVSKILFTDSVVNESVIKNFADIYICNPLFSFVKSDAINKQIIMIMKKFREDIPYCYDDLFIKEQMTRLAKCMKDDGVVDEAVEYWADEN